MDYAPVWHTRMGDAVAEDVEFGFARGVLPFISPPAYVERMPPAKVDYLNTDWWALFRRLEGDFGDPGNDFYKDGCLFRKRFRLPFSEFYPIYETVREEECAQIMVDKSRFWRELSLATDLNLDTTFYYRVMHGDKDLFAAAWMALGSRWYLIQASGVLGYSCKMRDDGKCVASLEFPLPGRQVCGTEWLRYDTDGKPLLAHHTKDIFSMTEFENSAVRTSWQLMVEYANTIDPAGAGISGGGFNTKMRIPDGSRQRSLSSGGGCLVLESKNRVVRTATPSIGNAQWLFYEVVNRNFDLELNIPANSFSCPNAPSDAGLVLADKHQLRSVMLDDDPRPKFLGHRTPCLCHYLVGRMSDPKRICLDHPMRHNCTVYDLGVQNERKFASSMRRLGCEVHSYDPTMYGVTAHDWFQRTGGGIFHDFGVSNFDGFVDGIGNVKTLASMMKDNGHLEIDYLKIDVESFEWDVLYEMHASGTLHCVGTIQMETHFWNKECFKHWVEWEKKWGALGYPPESHLTRACENKNAPMLSAISPAVATNARARWRSVSDAK